MTEGSMEPAKVRPLSFVSDGLAEEEWILEDRYGKCVPLHKTAMLFLGREECDITLKSKSVDGQHAVLVYDEFVERFKVKDLTSINGTFVNESRIPEDTYVYVEHADTLRFGYDSMVYRVLASSRINRDEQHKDSPSPPEKPNKREQDLPSWAAKEMETMESPTSCLDDQLLLPSVLPPVMAECTACIAESRMECHDCGHQDPTPREPTNHSCGLSSLPAGPRAPRFQSNGLPPARTRQETPPSSLPLNPAASSTIGPTNDVTPTAEEIASQLEQLRMQSPPGVTTPIHRATSATGASSPSNRRKSVRELYGQPSWWGEDDGDVYSYPHTASLAGQESKAPAPKPRETMQNPSAIPRDSLDTERPSTADTAVSSLSHAPATPTRPAEAFTVVFENNGPEEAAEESGGGDTPPPAALAHFVPSKIRKSFQERQQERTQGSKQRRQQTRPPPDKAKDSRTSARPARPLSSSSRPSARPLASGASRTSTAHTAAAAAAKKPPPGKRTPPVKSASQPATPPKRSPASALRKSGSSDRLKPQQQQPAAGVEAFGDPKSYLFERMFAGPVEAVAAVEGPAVTSPPPPPPPPAAAAAAGSPEHSDAGTYTIEREDEEYRRARQADVTRGCGDGGEEKAEVEAMEKEEEEEMDEPLSVCEMTDVCGMEEVEQEPFSIHFGMSDRPR